MKPKTVIAWHRTGFSSYWRWLSRSLSVTDFPSAPWVVQQLREAFSFDVAPRRLKYLLFDRVSVFSAEVIRTVASMALRPKWTNYRSPCAFGLRERSA